MKINRKPGTAPKLRRKDHPGQSIWLSKFWNLVVSVAYVFTHKTRVLGHGTVPATGSVLILAKHSSYSDVPLGKLHITRHSGRHLWCVMKESLAKGPFGGLLLRVGGIPISRENPEKSKHDLLLARRVLHDGHMLCIFPEQTIYLNRMGRGRAPGFRFVTGRPPEPIAVVCVGFHYTRRKWRRTLVEIEISAPTYYGPTDDPEIFLHERMHDIARLSKLEYPFERPEPKRERARAVETSG